MKPQLFQQQKHLNELEYEQSQKELALKQDLGKSLKEQKRLLEREELQLE